MAAHCEKFVKNISIEMSEKIIKTNNYFLLSLRNRKHQPLNE